MKGAWDSIHVVEVNESHGKATYKLTSTVMLYMKTNKPGHGEMNLSGSMTRQVEQKDTVVDENNPHIANIGRLVEDMEIKMRNVLQVRLRRRTARSVRTAKPRDGAACERFWAVCRKSTLARPRTLSTTCAPSARSPRARPKRT